MNKVDAVVFDLDGTLVDSGKVVLDAFQFALESYGKKVNYEEIEKIRSRSPLKVFEGFVPEEDWPNAFSRLSDYSEKHVADAAVFNGIHEILEQLQIMEVKTAVWTGRDQESAIKILKANGIYDYFPVVVGGCMVNRNKPHCDGLLLVSEMLTIGPANILVIGDHAHDWEGSKTAGADFVGAAWAPRMNEEYFRSLNVEKAFSRVEDFHKWLIGVRLK